MLPHPDKAARMAAKKARKLARRAGDLYARAGLEEKAEGVLAFGGCPADAADLALRAGRSERAAELLLEGGEVARAAEVLRGLGRDEEAARILVPRGWFACIWNHRDLDDPLQSEIERTIRLHLPDYNYGSRREDQTAVIERSGLFQDVTPVTGRVVHEQTVADGYDAWYSHATLQRQAGPAFEAILRDIRHILEKVAEEIVGVFP